MAGKRKSFWSLVLLVLVVAAANQWWSSYNRRALGEQVAELAKPGDIRMLSSDTCAICVTARRWFEQNQVAFTECSIERDAACRREFEATGSPGTPVMLVRGQAMVGFSPQLLLARLSGPQGRVAPG